jgi:hypothetical protein
VVSVDGAAALRRFTEGGAAVDSMTGKEMYAIVDLLKQEYGGSAAELENSLLRVKRQLDKKIALLAWVSDNVCPVAEKLPLADRTNKAPPADMARPVTAPPSKQASKAAGDASERPLTSMSGTPRVADEASLLQLINALAAGPRRSATATTARPVRSPGRSPAAARSIRPKTAPTAWTQGETTCRLVAARCSTWLDGSSRTATPVSKTTSSVCGCRETRSFSSSAVRHRAAPRLLPPTGPPARPYPLLEAPPTARAA